MPIYPKQAIRPQWRREDDKQRLAGTGGRVNGHQRNRQNRRQQHSESQSAYVVTIGVLGMLQFISWCERSKKWPIASQW